MDLVHKKSVTAACGCTSCVNLKEPRIYSVHEDRLVYFCSPSCKREFDKDPADFLNSNHFKIEFDVLDTVEERSRDKVSDDEVAEIEAHRRQLDEDGILIHLKS